MGIINKKIEAILNVAKLSTPSEADESIDVKLPNFKNLKDTSRFFNDLNNALEIAVVNNDINGKVELKNFESGSLWITICLGTPTAVTLIGKIVSTALKLKAKFHETESLKATARSLNAAADAQELLLKALDEQLATQSKLQADELLRQSPIKDDSPEYTAKFVHVVTTFTKLIYEGAEIHAALSAPKESQNDFPAYPKLDVLESLKEIPETLQSSVGEDEELIE